MRYALILAGGSGTRLWPLSRDAVPKQLIPVLDGRSLLEEAYDRLEGLVPAERRFVCAAERHRAAVASRLPMLGSAGARRPRLGSGSDPRSGPDGAGLGARYVGEPEGRDTLAAVALSCSLIAREDPDAVVGIFTSDHVIRPRDEFRALAERAYALAESGPSTIVTFGVEPDRPATGFGYLELGDPLEGRAGAARRVVRFREKPDAESAARYLAAGPAGYLWNSGMFFWKAAFFLGLVARYEPEFSAAIGGIASAPDDAAFRDRLARVYPSLKKTSVDYGVMETASRDAEVLVAAIPLGVEWRDIGSWPQYGELLEADASGNASSGKAALVESSGTIAVSSEPGHLVACLGCEDLIVVHTPDATLVCPRSRAEEMKKLYAEVSSLDGGRYR